MSGELAGQSYPRRAEPGPREALMTSTEYRLAGDGSAELEVTLPDDDEGGPRLIVRGGYSDGSGGIAINFTEAEELARWLLSVVDPDG